MMGTNIEVEVATTVLARQVEDDADPLTDATNRPPPMIPARDADVAAAAPPCVKVGAAADAVTTPNARLPADEGIAPTTTRKALELRVDAEINARKAIFASLLNIDIVPWRKKVGGWVDGRVPIHTNRSEL